MNNLSDDDISKLNDDLMKELIKHNGTKYISLEVDKIDDYNNDVKLLYEAAKRHNISINISEIKTFPTYSDPNKYYHEYYVKLIRK